MSAAEQDKDVAAGLAQSCGGVAATDAPSADRAHTAEKNKKAGEGAPSAAFRAGQEYVVSATGAPSVAPSVAIVGAGGRMGAMLMRRLCGAVRDMRGLDVPLTPERVRAAVDGADMVLCCVPAAAMPEVVAACAPHMRPDAILADIVSVKVQPMATMERLWPGPCVGTHPLFGPAPAQDMELRVCVTAGSRAQPSHVTMVEALFAAMGAQCFRSTPEEHDRAVSVIQSMNFITSLAYFAMLADHEELTPYITPSFLRRQEAARKLLTEDGELFTWLFDANPYAHESVRTYRNLLNVAAGGDIELLLGRARRWLEKHAPMA